MGSEILTFIFIQTLLLIYCLVVRVTFALITNKDEGVIYKYHAILVIGISALLISPSISFLVYWLVVTQLIILAFTILTLLPDCAFKCCHILSSKLKT